MFLLKMVGVRDAKLGQVRYYLLCLYTFFECFHASSVHREIKDGKHGHKRLSSLLNSSMWL